MPKNSFRYAKCNSNVSAFLARSLSLFEGKACNYSCSNAALKSVSKFSQGPRKVHPLRSLTSYFTKVPMKLPFHDESSKLEKRNEIFLSPSSEHFDSFEERRRENELVPTFLKPRNSRNIFMQIGCETTESEREGKNVKTSANTLSEKRKEEKVEGKLSFSGIVSNHSK